MKLLLDVPLQPPSKTISYSDKIFLIGSCFTEHIGKRLGDLKFRIIQNPNGILFDPLSLSRSLDSYISNKVYRKEELFMMNELWQSWEHHSHFSGMNATVVLEKINASQLAAHEQLKAAQWLIITLGSSFTYQLISSKQFVANCHRAPGQCFQKHLLSVEETCNALVLSIEKLKAFNPLLNIIFTISPVRHIRDGVVENNRSKARLIEVVHSIVDRHEHAHYFPAYEIVIDVLRDYRFYDIDLVHPNYAATEFVFEKFVSAFIDNKSQAVMEEIKTISNSFKHKPFHPETQAHHRFMQNNFEKAKALQDRFQHLDFSRELEYFSVNTIN